MPLCRTVLLVATILLAITKALLGASFQAVSSSELKDVSDSGAAAIGFETHSATSHEALLWQGGTITNLGDLPGGAFDSVAWGISGDGQVVVGQGTSSSGGQAFSWKNGVMSALPYLPGTSGPSIGYAANSDGSVVVGASESTYGLFPVRWNNGTVQALQVLPGPYHSGKANGISSNGRYISGYDAQWNGTKWVDQAVVWRDGVIAALGDLPGGDFNSISTDVSDDASVVVGRGASTSFSEAFRWSNGIMTGLGFLNGGSLSLATGVSADGSLIVGNSDSSSGQQAIIWDAQHGMRNLRDVLISDYGVPLEGWTLYGANAVSPNGRFIVGGGRTPNGLLTGWIAEIPEPSTLMLVIAGAAMLNRRRLLHRDKPTDRSTCDAISSKGQG